MTIPFPMPTFPSPTAAMPPDSIAFIARGNDNQIIAGLNQVAANIGHTLTFGTHLQSAGTSYNGSANVTIATDATSANTVSTIVARDTSGNFSANSVTLAGTLTLSGNGAILSGASGSKGLAITATTGEILDYSTTGQNGDMPAGGILVNSSLTTGHRALSIFANDGTAGITVGAYYFTNSAVETVFQYANAIGKAQGSTAFQFYPKGGEVSFGQNYAASGNTKAFIRMYGTTTSNAGGSATLIVQQGGITTDTLAASALLSANGGLTVASGQTLTLTGVTVVGLSFTPITGNLTYAQLPTGNGTWDTGAGTLITIARSITVSGTTSTVGFTVSNTASFLNASPFSMSGGGGNVVTVAITLPTAGATVTIPDFAGVNDTFAFVTLAQTLANKTLASSCSVPASTLTGQIAYAALPSGSGNWDAGAGNTTTITRALTVSGLLTASIGVVVTAGGLKSNATVNDQWDNTGIQTVFQTAATYGPRYAFRTSQGSLGSPTATANTNEIGRMEFAGHNGSAYVTGAQIIGEATQAWGVGTTGAELVFNVTTNGASVLTTALTLQQNLTANFAGLINAQNGVTISSGKALICGGLITNYNNVATAGFGVQTIYASGRVTAKTNVASGTICTYTPAADGTFQVQANVLVTTSTTFSFTVTCTYTDEGGTSRTQIFSFAQVAGTLLQTLTNTTGAGTYVSVPFTIRAKGANAITIQTAAGGTYTAVVFNASAAITQLAA